VLMTALYLGAAYLALFPFIYRVIGFLWGAFHRRSFLPRAWYGLLSIVLLSLPFLPYAQVAWLTRQYGRELRQSIQNDSGFWSESPTTLGKFWVLQVTPRTAEVYITERCRDVLRNNPQDFCASTLRFTRSGTQWQFQDWRTVWSSNGLAQGNVFPPDPHAP
jgi:hypothetical protein